MQHLPFPGTGLPKLIESYWTAKCEARKGGECLFSSSFFPFCLCFGGFGVLGFAVVEGFFLSCRFLPLPFCSPLCSKVRPGRRLVPGPEATLIPGAAAALPPPPPPNPRKAEADPHQPEPLLSPSENTDARSSAWAEERGGSPRPHRGANPPCSPGCKRPHGLRPATAKNEFKKKNK